MNKSIAFAVFTAFLFFLQTLRPAQAQIPDDPFKPYLDGRSPKVIKELGEVLQDSVRIRKLVFHSRDVQTTNGPVSSDIFAAIIRPAKAGFYPGLLVLHGGGGNAELDRGVFWASKGYIVTVLDEPGIANPDKVSTYSQGTWKNTIYGKSFFNVMPDVKSSSVFDGVLATLQAFYLLRSQPDVIRERIGVTGISWGGYLTTMVTSLAGTAIHASFSTFGSGFYDEGSAFLKDLDKLTPADRALWLKYLDAGRRADQIKTPFFIAGAANDVYFHPPAVTKTLMTIQSKEVNHLFGPNKSHAILLPGGGGTDKSPDHPGWLKMEQDYFDYSLKDKGFPLPLITAAYQIDNREQGQIKVRFQVKAAIKITNAVVYYSFTDAEWPKRVWIQVQATAVKYGWYTAELPVKAVSNSIDWYATVSDARPVSVSSYIMRSK
jgi:cephalosporin-C deacetylase-like acetyl esterase